MKNTFNKFQNKFLRLLLFGLFIFVQFLFFTKVSMSQWEPDVRQTNDTAVSQTCFNKAWCVSAKGDSVNIVWFDNRDGNQEIYYKRSTDAGISWGADTRLTNNPGNSELPSILAIGSILHIVWVDERDGNKEIYYKRSTDAGISWGADIRLTDNPYNQIGPALTVSGQIVHVVWEDDRDGNNEVYYKRSTDGGVSWGLNIRLTNNPANSGRPSITVSALVVHVVFRDDRDGNFEIYYKRSTDGGVTWEPDTRLTNNAAESFRPSISVYNSVVHTVWYDMRDGSWREIYYKRSTDGGISWGPDIRLTFSSWTKYDPGIFVSGMNVHIIWWDSRDGNFEIYYKRSIDGGVSWGEPDTRLTNDPASSNRPSISISNSVIHVVWFDFRNGNDEIYYKRNPTGNIVGINKINLETPAGFSLYQNYPNPFNPITKIKFDLPKSNFTLSEAKGLLTKLTVYDILGKEVAALVNEQLNPGTYSVEFVGSKLSSGVYFYRLEAGDYLETKKMLMIK